MRRFTKAPDKTELLTPKVRQRTRRKALERKALGMNLQRRHDAIDEAWRKADPYGPQKPQRSWRQGLIAWSVVYVAPVLFWRWMYAEWPPIMFQGWFTPALVIATYLGSWLACQAMCGKRIDVRMLPVHGLKPLKRKTKKREGFIRRFIYYIT